MVRRSPNEYTYMRNVANYGVRYFACPNCGSGPREACTKAPPGKIACPARWEMAREEYADPARRRPYETDTLGKRLRAAEAAGEPESLGTQQPTLVVPLADPAASPAWRYRKLRQFLAPHGVILAKVRGEDRYQIVDRGRLIAASISLAGAESWAVNYWERSAQRVNGDPDN
jgi:hypothetical protein